MSRHTQIYDVRLMSSVNTLSNRQILGGTLLQEFTPPRKPTGKILMETKEQMLHIILLMPNCQIMMVTPLFTHSHSTILFFPVLV